MSDIENEEVLEMPDELTALKARADLLGISYHPSIGLEKLRDKVNAAVSGDVPETKKEDPVQQEEETKHARLVRRRKEANELIRIRVTCMNPNKREWDGEIFTTGNSTLGTLKKYVPFNADEGWHVPRAIYNQIIERQCQIFVPKKDSRGNTTKEGKLIKEFAVEVLPNLTVEELEELARKQAMARSID